MDKPIILIKEETKQKLLDVINQSGLPAFIIEPILSDFLNEIRVVARREYETEKANYEKSLKEKVDSTETTA